MKTKIAFFWMGESIKTPTMLVDSIRLVMGREVAITQLTDRTTPTIKGCDHIERHDLPSDLMIARLRAYSAMQFSDNLTFFCDADSLFISPLDVSFENEKIKLIERGRGPEFNTKINCEYPEYYPEFENKTIGQLMPFMFGAIATFGDQSNFFEELEKICTKLPKRFHRWYGDQVSLKIAIEKKSTPYDLLDNEKHLYLANEILSVEQITMLRFERNVQMISFKGSAAKNFLAETLNNLKSSYHEASD